MESTSKQTNLIRTPLYDLHQELGARLVPFAGFEMPLQYKDGIRAEHVHTRTAAGLFDVSHMGQITISGDTAALAKFVPADLETLAIDKQCYTVLTNDTGGIIDDLIVGRTATGLSLVVNAASRGAVCDYLKAGLSEDCELNLAAGRALLALQGPAALEVMHEFDAAPGGCSFMQVTDATIAGIACRVSRSGYTGEDGFEISLDGADVEKVARSLLADARVLPIGLGARDSLRLEAGLCLAGSDIGPDRSPVQAGLSWLIAKRYRAEGGLAEARFPGAARILQELREGPAVKRIGLKPDGRVPLRGGMGITDDAGAEVGVITSGSFGATVEHPIAMGYVNMNLSAPGTQLQVEIRGRGHHVKVATLPFVAHNYFRS